MNFEELQDIVTDLVNTIANLRACARESRQGGHCAARVHLDHAMATCADSAARLRALWLYETEKQRPDAAPVDNSAPIGG